MKTHITALTHDGRGIAQIDGKTIFIQGALPGEEVIFEYTKRRGKFDEGQVTEIITASSERVEPLCKHFKICGGCALQHMSSTSQLQMKQQTLLNQLQHFGGVQPKTILPPLTGSIWGYRRKARLSVKYVGKKEAVLVGFHEKNGRYIADIASCVILKPPMDNLITPLKQLIQSLNIFQQIPQIEVAVADNTTALVFRNLVAVPPSDSEKLIAFAKEHNIHLYLQPGGPQTIHLLWPELEATSLSYRLPDYGLELDFHPTNFIQINADINQRMLQQALGLLELKATDRVLDLFCGIGNFTLPLAKNCQQAIGVEGDAELVAHALHNANKNLVTNVEFHQLDLNSDWLASSWAQNSFNKILLDPPRVGALPAIQQIVKFNAERIVYISCNPATLARDAGELAQHGYRLTTAGILDMFPHTHHVEAMALFEKL